MSQTKDRERVMNAQHIVIKLGSNVLLRDAMQLDRPTFAALIQGMDTLIKQGHQVTVVSSGAVALGRQALGGLSRPRSTPKLQALAALGQSQLIQLYEREFGFYGRDVAQLLLNRYDLDDRPRYLNARHALQAVHEYGAIPIINENDSVATEELCFGDNDRLAAMACGLAQADLLVILSDVDGVYEVDDSSGARRFTTRISQIEANSAHLDEIAGPSASGVGMGGMVTKILASRIAARFGVPTVIAPGKLVGVLEALMRGDDVGTLLTPSSSANVVVGKKVWLGAGAVAVGELWLDNGAVTALKERGASLLSSGLIKVVGEFDEGAVVDLVGPDGRPFARGVSVYPARDLRLLCGVKSDQIYTLLGYKIIDEVIHRDDLLVL